MTVLANDPVSGPHIADGVNRQWQFQFKITELSQMRLRITDADGTNPEIVTTGFAIVDEDINNNLGGYVEYPVSPIDALVSGKRVSPYRDVPYDQLAKIGNQGGFFPATHERAFDKTEMQIQQNRRDINQSLRRPFGVTIAGGRFVVTTDDGYVIDGGAAEDLAQAMEDAAQVAEDRLAVEAALAAAQALLDEITELLGGLTDPVIQSYAVDETTASINLPVADPLFCFIFNEGVYLEQGSDYTISGNTLTPVTAFTPSKVVVLAMAAVTLPISQIMRKRYEVASDYVPANDSLSSVAGERAAFLAASGKELVYDAPYGGVKYYRGTARGNGRVGSTVRKITVHVADGAIIDRTAYGTSGSQSRYFEHYAQFDTVTRALASPAARGDETITFANEADAAAYSKWGYGLLASDDLLVGSATDYRSEWVQIVERTGAVVKLFAPLRDDYTTNARVLRAIELCEVKYNDPKILGAGKNVSDSVSGDRGIWIGHGLNCGVDGGYVRGAQMQSIALDSVINGYVKNCEITLDPSVFAGAQYPVAIINNCENTSVDGNRITNGREGVALTDTGMPAAFGFATGGGIPRDISIKRNEIRNQHRSGVTTHWAGRGLRVAYNVLQFNEQGVDVRIRGNTEVDHNVIEDTGTHGGNLNMALQLSANAADVTFAYNTVKRAGRGVVMAADEVHIATPGNFKIFKNIGEDIGRVIGGSFVEIHNTTASTAECGTIEVGGNVVKFDGSSPIKAVEIEGNWKPTIRRNEWTDAGPGSYPTYLHATANGTGANGPREITIEGERWSKDNFSLPTILHMGAGVPTISDNKPFGGITIPVFKLNSSGNPGLLTVPMVIIAARDADAPNDNFDGMVPVAAGSPPVILIGQTGQTITVRNGGNMRTKTGADTVLKYALYACDGVNWYEV